MAGSLAGAELPRLTTEEFRVPTRDGATLYVRNKHLPTVRKFSGERILLFVHGATYPAETSFDLSVGGFSWMEFIARDGYDVYFVDVRGYGQSSRPSEMDLPAESNAPLVRTEIAVKDIAVAVDFILKRRAVSQLNLMGWSWGTVLMGAYTAQNNDKVGKLVLYAPAWLRNTPPLNDTGGPLGAYRNVSMDAARKRWLTGVPPHKQTDLIPSGWFEAFASAVVASDPTGARQNPPVLRAPNGVMQDGREYWGAAKPYYDPGQITVPTFLAHAEWDQDTPSYMLHALFARLVRVPYKRYVEIGEGTHTILLEKNRMQLFGAVQQFLDERFRVE